MNSQELENILVQCGEIVSWYKESGCTSMAIHEISEQKDVLGGLLYFLSDLSCDLRAKYGDATVVRKIKFNKIQELLIEEQREKGEKRNVSRATSKAEYETEEEIKSENESRNLAARCEIMIAAIRINITNMTQRVGLLKQEQPFSIGEQYLKLLDRLSDLEGKINGKA
jgi:hypothetical protein